ncbi:30S ribosomal protein S13 [Candidatus Falkowbacteria bacterium RBG_13_39_14]|uniref:Small ribosomal subunit protein uS13 n=1 Tax=Candidatus Falkowbacteria bacterium RBG_13_39_14 TaxID=1797985 RepID=A0A1F5S9M9_9BACT|nr:MAG: 30S ribosomal protein S13 [Candidatus Falkowbacteria bacterium RBG_13_39_14]
MVVRIAGVTLPQDKRIEIGLTYLYGIGRSASNKILKDAGVNFNTRVKDLDSEAVNKLRALIEKNLKVEGDLRREVLSNIKRLREINSYRGSRHAKGLPARGQRTKTNSRTVRGNVRRTMGSGRKPAAQKT